MLPKDTNDKEQKKIPTTASPKPANSIFNKADASKTMPKSQEQAKSTIASRPSITSKNSSTSFTKNTSSSTSVSSSVSSSANIGTKTSTVASTTTNTTLSKSSPSASQISSTNKTSPLSKASTSNIINTSVSSVGNTSSKTVTTGQSTTSARPTLQKDLSKTASMSKTSASTSASSNASTSASTSAIRTANSSNSLTNRPTSTSTLSTLNKASTSSQSAISKASNMSYSAANTSTTSANNPTKLASSSSTSTTKTSTTASSLSFSSNSSLANTSSQNPASTSNLSTLSKISTLSKTSSSNRTNPIYTSTSSSLNNANISATKTEHSQISGLSSRFTNTTNKSSILDTNKSNISKGYEHTKLTTVAEKTAKIFPQIPSAKQEAFTSSINTPNTSNISSAFSSSTKIEETNAPKLTATPLNIASGKAELSDKDFVLLRDFIHKQSGIFINDNRKYLVQNRLTGIITDLGLSTFADYYEYITKKDSSKSGLNKLFEAITTNETFFFRNIPQLDTLRDLVLKKIIDNNKSARKLRIWSAGCSSGEEPYTIAIMLCELLGRDIDKWDIKITANDLSPAVLELAKAGVYNEYTLRTTPPEYLTKYFDKEGLGYRVKASLKKLITFGQINLNESSQTSKVEKSHLVLCRNVIIYFDDDVKRNVVKNFADNLLENGVLVIGHSESLHNITTSFEAKHYPGTVIYHKK